MTTLHTAREIHGTTDLHIMSEELLEDMMDTVDEFYAIPARPLDRERIPENTRPRRIQRDNPYVVVVGSWVDTTVLDLELSDIDAESPFAALAEDLRENQATALIGATFVEMFEATHPDYKEIRELALLWWVNFGAEENEEVQGAARGLLQAVIWVCERVLAGRPTYWRPRFSHSRAPRPARGTEFYADDVWDKTYMVCAVNRGESFEVFDNETGELKATLTAREARLALGRPRRAA